MGSLEHDYLALSGIQHFAFCPRQWALIDVAQLAVEIEVAVPGPLWHNGFR